MNNPKHSSSRVKGQFLMRQNWLQLCNDVEPTPGPNLGGLGRRDFVYRLGKGLGSVALSSLLYQDGWLAASETSGNPLAPKPPHLPGKAKSCIFPFYVRRSQPDGHLRPQTGFGPIPRHPGDPHLG